MISISIITVVFNDLEGLKRTAQSVFGQVGSSFEWIVCDGGSGEKTTNYLALFGEEVRWVSEPDKGIYDAMNRGVSIATGDYVVFMNAGDTFYNSGTLAQVVVVLSAGDQVVDILFGGAMLSFGGSGRTVYRPPRLVENSLWHGLPANHQATFYRKTLLDKTPYDLQYQLCGDYYLAAMLMRNRAHTVYLDRPLATFEVGGQSYKRRRQLFIEPYRIQRDVLGLPFYYRLASVAKRFVSMAGFVLLSQHILKKKSNNGG